MKKFLLIMIIVLCAGCTNTDGISNIKNNNNGTSVPVAGYTYDTNSKFVNRDDLVKDEKYTEIPKLTIKRGEQEEIEFTIKTENSTEMEKQYTLYVETSTGDIKVSDIDFYVDGEYSGHLVKKGDKNEKGYPYTGVCFTVKKDTENVTIALRLSKNSTLGNSTTFTIKYYADGIFYK